MAPLRLLLPCCLSRPMALRLLSPCCLSRPTSRLPSPVLSAFSRPVACPVRHPVRLLPSDNSYNSGVALCRRCSHCVAKSYDRNFPVLLRLNYSTGLLFCLVMLSIRIDLLRVGEFWILSCIDNILEFKIQRLKGFESACNCSFESWYLSQFLIIGGSKRSKLSSAFSCCSLSFFVFFFQSNNSNNLLLYPLPAASRGVP
uniref:Uncharacterized protein n=1 Tax=Ananas comosus var. bracteatus TaxID=296719 RepID=A0A6V7Q675_ANACO|nr:unnamed protein product [Ananas comosus var. bracteatus]